MTPATNQRGHLSSETMDLLLLAALKPDEANAAKAHLEDCERCKDHWRELNDDKAHFEQFVFPRTLPKVEARAAKPSRSIFEQFRLAWVLPVVGLGLAGVVVLATFGPKHDEPYVGLKGGPALEVFALRPDGAAPFEVKRGARLQPHDRIRFVVTPGAAKYVLVASRDGAGAFTVYSPFGATESARLPAVGEKGRAELPDAVELDETLGAESVIAVFSDQPVKASAVEAAVKAQGAQAITVPGATVVPWDFIKVPSGVRAE
jgi:hypothetical protein